MADDSAGARFSLGLPAGWITLPTSPEAVDGVIAEFEASSPTRPHLYDAQRAALKADLERAVAAAQSQEKPARLRYAYLGGSEQPEVSAWAAMEGFSTGGIDADTFARTVADTPPAVGPEAAIWRREVQQSELGSGSAVVLYDLVALPAVGDGARTLQQRLVVTIFPPALDGVAAQFHLSTDDLAAFDDFVGVGLAMAGTITLHERPARERV